MKIFTLLLCALLLALAGPAAAQDNDLNPPAPCQVEPQAKDGNQPPANGDSGGLTGKLAACGGVLQPPPSGDQSITQPPPDQGNTPVIKPGEVPVQPPKQ